jgi:hypothetical protein
MSVKNYIIAVLVFSGIIALAGYYLLGGFKERELNLVEVGGYRLVGKEFKGRFGNQQLEDIFFEVQEHVQEGEPAGTFTIVVLREPENEKDTLHQFIGILLDNPSAPVPEGWQPFELDAEQAVRSTIRSHNLVMPKPIAIREELEDYAQTQNVKLQPGITIEKYLGERHLQIEVPLQ